ncbi:MAG TPA: phosphoadenosine phosphosulfate reductase family protein [Conexibacter sp.]|nr:phosphoadenosine phosphosulfate reductase family protein [Conexibacter sp.]
MSQCQVVAQSPGAPTSRPTRQLDLIEGTRRTPEQYVREAIDCAGCPIKTVCLLSGGGDSTVTAHRCRDFYDELAFIDTGTALPGVRDFVIAFAAWLGKPLRIFDSGDAYRNLVLGDDRWWSFYTRERRRSESVSDFVVRTTPSRRRGDGLGNAPQGFPGPGGGHRAAYARLKERQVEALLREAKRGRGRRERVALLSGARRYESRRRSMTQGVEGWRLRKSQLWINPLNDWRNEEMVAYRQEHGIPQSDVAALLHRSGECNCGAYMSVGEIQDVRALFPDWHRDTILPLEAEARAAGLPRQVWGERVDTGRAGARGFPFGAVDAEQLALSFDQGVPEVKEGGSLCSSCAARTSDDASASEEGVVEREVALGDRVP